jgi:hypothetical protein
VRATLKPDLSRIVLDLPATEQAATASPSLWQRVKVYWARGAVNPAIDGYMTPE